MEKITRINHTSNGATYTALSMNEAAEMLRSGSFANEVAKFRQEMNLRSATNNIDDYQPSAEGIPDVCFAALWRKRNDMPEMRQYNGLVMLEISNLPTSDEAIRLCREVSRIPYTRLAFVGATGKEVIIVCALTAEGMADMTTAQHKALQLSAYKRLHYLYSSQLMVPLHYKRPALDSRCAMSFDANAYYNPVSEAFFVSEGDGDVPVYHNTRNNLEPLFRDCDVLTLHTIYEWCMTTAWEEAREYAGENNITDENLIAEKALHSLASNCNDAEIPIDFAVRRASWYKPFGSDANYIEQTFVNAYEQMTSKMIPYGFVNKNALMAYKIEAFLKMHYELRRNLLTGVVQYRNKDGYKFDFQDLTEEAINTMTNRAVKAGIGSWDKDVRRIIKSSDVAEYDPIEDYIGFTELILINCMSAK